MLVVSWFANATLTHSILIIDNRGYV